MQRVVGAIKPRHSPRVAAVGPSVVQSPESLISGASFSFLVLGVYVFFLFSRAVEFIDTTGSLHLMIVMALAAGFCAVMSGGIVRAFSGRIGFCLLLFTGWMLFSIPFSIWKGGSVNGFINGWAKSFITFILIAALLRTRSQCRKLIFIIACATAVVIAIVDFYTFRGGDQRLSVEWGTLGNPNDLATELLIGLPFCVYVATDKARSSIVRFGFIGVSVVLLGTVLKTGSRGGLIAILILTAFLFVKASPGNKLKIAAGFLALAACLPFVLTPELKARYLTILQSGDAEEAAASTSDLNLVAALQSTEARRDMLKHAMELSVHHPLLGVGYGQFPNADATRAANAGEFAYWHEVHNIFAQIMVENGVPAVILFGCAFGYACSFAGRLYKRTRNDPSQTELARLSFCLLVALTVFFVCDNFATDAYGQQFPVLAGITAALEIMSRKQPAISTAAAFAAAVPSRTRVRRPARPPEWRFE